MKILHTSDWHLGRSLYGKQRYHEFAAFLDWLVDMLVQHEVDVLLVAGDIFDTSTPGNRAQSLYYRFLRKAADSCCQNVVLIAGNHDSASFLNAPQELLRAFNVYVVGNAAQDPADEVLVLRDQQQQAQLLVCAVPYLRDRDLRLAQAGESFEDKERKLTEGIRNHYARVTEIAKQRRRELGGRVPIVALGHLFTAGGLTLEDDGVRTLYVGSLAHVTAKIFSDSLDYVALGHLHVPQTVDGNEWVRYSGSPLAIGFSEAEQQKSVCLVTLDSAVADTAGANVKVQLLAVPTWQPLQRIKGDRQQLADKLVQLSLSDSRAWLEIIYDGDEMIADLREWLNAAIAGSAMEILRVRHSRLIQRALCTVDEQETLADMDVNEVFARCLEAHQVPAAQRPLLLSAYQETLQSLDEDDPHAE